ncbi:hypothetical protein [Bacillus subtilis]|uniref:hypothetical protein n=1 Tax=Bacillus subtilis TaxID=1423 RepID=UPI002DBB17D0|nr:hypothetical protein [Bacillus subtilis]MEC1273371.1 hypothetical protein [Bacillus subtilis]MEC1315901.1 hypothetical protein [Bacillus subtilis]MEC1496255.1 hypothetical protein [Bacillus subtilis]
MTISIMMAIPYKLIKRSNAILSPLAVFIILTKKEGAKGLFLLCDIHAWTETA